MKDISSLTNISNNYLKQGNKPRVLVSVADARDGTIEGRFWASQAYTSSGGNAYSDRIHSARTIRHTIEPFGGMSAVSGTNISILKADSDIKFYQSVTLDTTPHPGTGQEGHGRFLAFGSNYTNVQNASIGSISNSTLTIGQNKVGSTFLVYRTFLQYTMPTLTSVEDAYIKLTGAEDSADTNFTLKMYVGTWSNGQYSSFDYDSYDDTGNNLIEEFTTSANTIVDGTTYYIRFNRTGRDLIKDSYSGSVIPLMIVSSLDVAVTEPSGAEFIRFNPSTMPTLTLQYNTVKPDNRTATIYIGYADSSGTLPTAESSMLQLWTGVVDKYTLDPQVFDIQLRHDDFRHNVLIPQYLIDTTTFPNVPEDNVGLPYPVAIGKASELDTGAHTTGVSRYPSWATSFQDSVYLHNDGMFDYFPSPIIDNGTGETNDPIQILVGVKDTQKIWNKGWITTWVDEINTYGRYVSTATQTSTVFTSTLNEYALGKVFYDRRQKDGVDREGGSGITFQGYRGTVITMLPSYMDASHSLAGYDMDEFITTNGATLASKTDFAYTGFDVPAGLVTNNKVEMLFRLSKSATNSVVFARVIDLDKANLFSGEDGTYTFINQGSSKLVDPNVDFTAEDINAQDGVFVSGDGSNAISAVNSATRLTVSIFSLNQPDLDSRFDQGSIEYRVTEPNPTAYNNNTTNFGIGPYILDVTASLTRSVENYLIGVGIVNSNNDPLDTVVRYPQLQYYTDNQDIILKLYSDKYGEHGTIASVADTLYEIPSDVIRALAVNHGGLDNSTEIDDDSFDTAQTDLANWAFGFQLPIDDKTQKQLFTYAGKKGILHELAEQCKSSVFFNNEGELKIKVFDATDPFPNSSTNVPDDLDIFEYSGSPSSDSFTKHGIAPGSYRIDIVDIDKVYNDYTVKYNLRYGDYNYIKTVYMNHGDGDDSKVSTNISSGNLESSSTLAELKLYTSGAYTALNNKINILVYEAWAIRQEATATKFLQSLIEWYSRRRYIIEFDTYFSAIAFEEADFINIRTPDIEDTFGTATMNTKKWKIIEYSPNLGNFTIHIKAIEAEIY